LSSNNGQPATADWIRVREVYAPSGTYESSVLDAGATVSFAALSFVARTPPNTSVSFATRSAAGRYLQYRATLSTTEPTRSPVLEKVVVTD
jgi:hypothetical protein